MSLNMPAEYREAKECERRGEFDEAMVLLRKAMETTQNPLKVLNRMGAVLHSWKKSKEALMLFNLNEHFLGAHTVTSSQRNKYRLIRDKVDRPFHDWLFPTCILVEVMVGDPQIHQFPGIFGIDRTTVSRLFSNIRDVKYITPAFGSPWKSNRAIIEFSTHAAARRALETLLITVCNVRAAWASLEAQSAEIASDVTKYDQTWETTFSGERIISPHVQRFYPVPH